jgi:hypothetical protein
MSEPIRKPRRLPKEQLAILKAVRHWMAAPNDRALCQRMADLMTTHQLRDLMNAKPKYQPKIISL